MPETYPRFFVEETSLCLDAAPPTEILEQQFEAFIDLLRACRDKGEPIARSKNFYEIELFPGLSLMDLLFQRRSKLELDPIVKKSLQLALNHCIEWDEQSISAPAPVEVANEICEAPAIAKVHALLEDAHGAACICLGQRTNRSGILDVRVGEVARQIHFLTAKVMLPGFYRSLFEVEDLDANAYMENAAHAFPEIAFAPGLSAQFSRFDGYYKDVRPEVTHHLAVLNDHFQDLYKQADYLPDKTQKLLNSNHHVDASRESDKTRHNAKAMRERDVNVDHAFVAGCKIAITISKPVRCEWHTKIKPNTDRIHFHPGDLQVAGGRLFVGLFRDHLTT